MATNRKKKEEKNIQTLQHSIKQSQKHTVGSSTTKTNQKHKITNPQIKQAKQENKIHKKNFNEACRTKVKT